LLTTEECVHLIKIYDNSHLLSTSEALNIFIQL